MASFVHQLYVAWLGDSQAVLCRGGEPVELMDPHKPNRDDEKARIEAAGGVVVWYGAWRVNGVLSVARAIGDKKVKKGFLLLFLSRASSNRGVYVVLICVGRAGYLMRYSCLCAAKTICDW